MWSTLAIVACIVCRGSCVRFAIGDYTCSQYRSCESVQYTVYSRSATFVRLGTPVTIHTKLMLASSCSCVCVCVCVCVRGGGREVR